MNLIPLVIVARFGKELSPPDEENEDSSGRASTTL